jgi:hypothetical protein
VWYLQYAAATSSPSLRRTRMRRRLWGVATICVQPNLGVLEPTPLADQVMVSVELRPLRPTNMFCDGHSLCQPN